VCRNTVLLLFDATTQEGVHVNSVHITTITDTCVVAIDQLPGGTADDYRSHINKSIGELASSYCSFHNEDESKVREHLISNISKI
jgi:hypothetical protein